MSRKLVPFGLVSNSYEVGKLFGKLLLVFALFGFIGANLAASDSSAITTISSALCGIYSLIHTVIFIIGLVLIIVGGAMYAGAHVLPGNFKSQLQGYGMGMIVGGIAGVVIALSAPFIMTTIVGNSANFSTCST
ncbi:MAG: hypothetical protein ACP5UC_01360 [Candidatus Micrarchaeia archaeon]